MNFDFIKAVNAGFVHDGNIETIYFSKDFREFTIEVNCPNIKFFKTDEDFEYVNTSVIISFQEIFSFSLDGANLFELYEGRNLASVDILQCKITEAEKEDGDVFYQVNIVINNGMVDITLKVECEFLIFTPKEPLAFELAKNDKRYVFP